MSDPVRATDPAEAEPRTPLWLPGLGAALFLTAGLIWAATPPPPQVSAEESDAGAAADVAAEAAAPAASAAVPPARPAASAAPPSSAAAAAAASASAKLQRVLNTPPMAPKPRVKPPKPAH